MTKFTEQQSAITTFTSRLTVRCTQAEQSESLHAVLRPKPSTALHCTALSSLHITPSAAVSAPRGKKLRPQHSSAVALVWPSGLAVCDTYRCEAVEPGDACSPEEPMSCTPSQDAAVRELYNTVFLDSHPTLLKLLLVTHREWQS